jgi:hypothetical protein
MLLQASIGTVPEPDTIYHFVSWSYRRRGTANLRTKDFLTVLPNKRLCSVVRVDAASPRFARTDRRV